MKNIDIRKLRTPNENETIAIWINLEDVIEYISERRAYWYDVYKTMENVKGFKHKSMEYLNKVIELENIKMKLNELRE